MVLTIPEPRGFREAAQAAFALQLATGPPFGALLSQSPHVRLFSYFQHAVKLSLLLVLVSLCFRKRL